MRVKVAGTHAEYLISAGSCSGHFLTTSFDLCVSFTTSSFQMRKLSYINVRRLAFAHVSSSRQN